MPHGKGNVLVAFFAVFYSFIFILILIPNQALARQISGVVVDTQGLPVGQAIVRLQGTSFATTSAPNGHFILTAPGIFNARHITAWKSGYFDGGQPIPAKDIEYRIVLQPLAAGDNLHYRWVPPFLKQYSGLINEKAKEMACQNCHPLLLEEWKNSSHATSAANPFFLSFYNGTDAGGNKVAAPGYRSDFPDSNGNCAACHVPAQAMDNPLNADVNSASGVAKEGIFCDFCHKIDSTAIDSFGGHPGILSINFRRPFPEHQMFYGPYDDVFPGDDSYHPLYKSSNYCAPCHNGSFWNVLAYSEFQEWAESDYAKKNVQCQDCHMKSSGNMNRFALEDKGSNLRDPLTIPSHANFGIRDTLFMKEAIQLETHAAIENQMLTVSATVRNVNAGHAYPTGNPMRNMLLLVEASDGNGKSLSLIDGPTVPLWGGVGVAAEGNYAGMPGKGFAKVLKDVPPYAADSNRPRHFQRAYPAPHWRPVMIESDTRLAAKGSDISTYRFALPESRSGQVHITARLIYRRAYKAWLDAKGLEIPDLEIAQAAVVLGGENHEKSEK